MRLEDTDIERNRPEYEHNIYDGLRWLGLNWDEGPDIGGDHGPYRQSERKAIYKKHLEILYEADTVYSCFCTSEELDQERKTQQKQKLPLRYSGRCAKLSPEERRKKLDQGLKHTIRFRMPRRIIKFHDLIRGDVEFDCSTIGDFVIVKPNGDFIFHFTNIVDDITMDITHVIRGEDHLSNTPKHIALGQALGFAPRQYAHIPLTLNPDRSKMSKRKSQTAISDFEKQGYIPEAMVNFLALLGWSPGTDEEAFSIDELCQKFSIEAMGKTNAIFNIDKLDWFNGYYLRKMPLEELERKVLPYMSEGIDRDYFRKVLPLVQERLKRYDEIQEKTNFFFSDKLEYDTKLIIAKKHTAPESKAALKQVREKLAALDDFSAANIEKLLRKQVEQLGWKTGHLFMIVRVALTGSAATPPLCESMELLGCPRCLNRLDMAIEKLEEID